MDEHVIACFRLANVGPPYIPSKLGYCSKCGYPIAIALSTPVIKNAKYVCLECIDWKKVDFDKIAGPTEEQVRDILNYRRG